MEREQRGRRRPAAKLRGHCQLCSREFDRRQLIPARSLRHAVYELVASRHPSSWSESSWICRSCHARERVEALTQRLADDRGALSVVEQEIAVKAANHLTLATDIDKQFDSETTLGQRVADRVAAVGGSWPFLITFFLILASWIGINSFLLRTQAFDPYPYILLNLALSCLAAVQAPVIMMSQNRVSARDRMQANQDFRVNLKAELEVASLHEKIDHLLHSQWQHMVELQELQIDLLTEINEAKR